MTVLRGKLESKRSRHPGGPGFVRAAPCAFVGVLLAFLVLAVPLGNGHAFGMDSESTVRQQLRAKGLHIGYDAGNRRMVQMETMAKDVTAVSSNAQGFEKQRALSFFLAEELARSSIMRSLFHVVDAQAATKSVSGNGAAGQGTAVDSTVRSTLILYGCELEAVAETLEGGVLETSVALSWDPAAEKEMRHALSSPPGAFPPVRDDLGPSPEWKLWASQQDFGHTLGFRSFRDSGGILRFAGIGTVDVEGKTGASLVAAMRVARMSATANLAYALLGRIETSRSIHKLLTEQEEGEDIASRIETVVSEQVQKSVNAVIPAAEVYTTTIVHPFTGRALYVSVVGIEPQKLAEMRILGNGVSGGSASPAARPDHAVRPPSNRPDHSWRPSSGRPDHSPRPPSFRPQHPNGGNWPSEDEELDF